MPFQTPGAFRLSTTDRGLSLTGVRNEQTVMAALPGGGFVATWTSFDTGDGDKGCIRARFFNSDMTPQGAEFIVNSTVSGEQINSTVELLPGGRIVFSWQSQDSGDGSGGCIRARIFNANQSPVGPDFVVTDQFSSSTVETNPEIGVFGNGQMVASWGSRYTFSNGGRLFNGDGTGDGLSFTITSPDGGPSFGPGDFGTLPDGRVVMAYNSITNSNPNVKAIHVRVLNQDSPQSTVGDTVVSRAAIDSLANPSVSVRSDGSFLVAWSTEQVAGRNSNVQARAFTAQGEAIGDAEFILNTTASGNKTDAKVVSLADGRYLVAWSQDYVAGDGDIDDRFVGRLVLGDGTLASDEFILSDQISGARRYFDNVEALTSGGFVATWRSTSGQPLISAVEAQFFDPTQFSGTDGADFLVGGNFTDRMSGNGGIDVLKGGAGDDFLSGGSGNNSLDGGTGNDWLKSEAGAIDTLIGGTGNDRFLVSDAGDVVIENANGGTDTVEASLSYTLGANVEYLDIAAGSGALSGTGNELANRITGNSSANVLRGLGGNDTLIGGGGFDTFYGGTGNDTFYVDSNTDRVLEKGGEGIDTVITEATFTLASLGAEVEVLRTANPLANVPIDLTGNSYRQTITGNAAGNVIDSRGGGDTLIGLLGNDFYKVDTGDRIVEGQGGGFDTVSARTSFTLEVGIAVERMQTADGDATTAINLVGNSFVQQIYGNAGQNVLNGGGGADLMQGFGGNDIYVVDNAGDVVVEAANGGMDAVVSTVTYTLKADQSVETLQFASSTGAAALNLTGNNLANTIIGNAGNNVLNGGGGADVLRGQAGNDIYTVDNASDLVIEANNGGNDSVVAMVTYTLAANQSVETLQFASSIGAAPLNLTGNNLANTIIGNAGNNVLNGGGGADVLRGRAGNDIYTVDNANDLVIEANNEGNDSVVATVSYGLANGQSIEALRLALSTGAAALNLSGNDLANQLVGNAGANALNGREGADLLIGGGGRDVLAGGAGSDVFLFSALAHSGIGEAAADRVTDFTTGDRIAVSQIDANALVAGDQAFVLDLGGAFSAGEIHQTRIGANLLLDFNVDADAASEMSILLLNHGLLGSGDFTL